MKATIVLVLLGLFFLSGCVNITVTQKLYRDGTSDLILELSSDNEFIRNSALSQVMAEMEGAVVVETEKGFRITKEGIQVSDLQDKKTAGIIADTGFKKEFRFPFYYYTITIDNKGVEKPEEDEFAEAMAGLMAFNYVIEPFGTITETNGIYVGESKKAVKFNLLQTKVYTVTFRDFFLWSWIGGTSKILDRETSKVEINMMDLGSSPESITAKSMNDQVVQEPESASLPKEITQTTTMPSRTLSIYEKDRACKHLLNQMDYCHEDEGKDIETCAKTGIELTEKLYDVHGEQLKELLSYCTQKSQQ